MDNKLRSVTQFALYTLLFAVKNTVGLGPKIEYTIQAVYFMICFCSFYFLNKHLSRFNKQPNLIQKLIQLNLITLMITSLPLENYLGTQYFQFFREAFELINQTVLYFMWLSAFEQSLEKYNIEKQQSNKMISIFKILFTCGYPLYSGIEIFSRIFYQNEREYQILLSLELLYGIIFLFQYGHYYKYYQINNVKTGVNLKQHDPFDDELGEEIVDKQDHESIMYDYFRFSLICCLALIVNTIIKALQYERLSASYLKQQGIIVVYIYFVSNLVKGLDVVDEQKSFIEMGKRSEEALQE